MKPQPLINVRDVEQSAAFYCALFGTSQRGGSDHSHHYQHVVIGDELILQIHSPEADDNHEALVDPEQPLGNGVILWFETDDFHALLERIDRLGISLDREPFENRRALQMECWLHDPDGYQVVIAGPSAWPRTPLSQQTNDTAETS